MTVFQYCLDTFLETVNTFLKILTQNPFYSLTKTSDTFGRIPSKQSDLRSKPTQCLQVSHTTSQNNNITEQSLYTMGQKAKRGRFGTFCLWV